MTMNNTLSKVVIFTVGAALGSAVTWKLVKTKYERIAQEEIDSVKEEFSKRNKETVEEETEEIVVSEEMKKEYVDKIKELGYSSDNDDVEEVNEDMDSKPYVISPREFDEIGYKTVSLGYYEDGVFVTDTGKVIRDVDKLIGDINPKDHFGYFEDDSVFVRNDKLKTDYEILRHEGRYSEM